MLPPFQLTIQGESTSIPGFSIGPGGGTGRRKGLKIPRPYGCTGSIPVPGTIISFQGHRRARINDVVPVSLLLQLIRFPDFFERAPAKKNFQSLSVV